MHIGLFDSGVGGLTVLKELRKQIPQSQFSYLGDTARLPYGNKAPQTLLKYTQENIRFLDSLKVDVIVIACHSASSVSLSLTQSEKGTPVYNVIAPSCAEALSASKKQNIGVLATKATTASQVYPNKIKELKESSQVHSQACPLLVPLVEEGHLDDDITRQVLTRYLNPLMKQGVDTLILGCTHYPILKDEIAKLAPKGTQLIDPAQSVAHKIQQLDSLKPHKASLSIYLTDHAPHFIEHATRLLDATEALQIHYPETHLKNL